MSSEEIESVKTQQDTIPDEPIKKEELSTDKKPSSQHVLYAVEMLIFSLVGWAWLALRELMGSTPVADVTVLLSMLVCSVLNLVFALFFYTAEQFKDPAQAFFNHTVCICLIYIKSLSESITDGRGTICCVDGDVQKAYSLRLTYREAFFGGLTLHQPPASITLSFLTIFLILACAQAKACNENAREWPHRKLPLAVVCLVCAQQAMFGLMAPLCKDKDISTAVISMVVLALVCMVDVAWVYGKIADRDAVTMSGIMIVLIMELLQLTFEVLFMMLVGVLSAVHVVNLGGGDSLLIIIGIAFLWQMLLVLYAIMQLRNPPTDEPTQNTAEAEPAQATAARFRQTGTIPMLLPGVQELRRARDKKAW